MKKFLKISSYCVGFTALSLIFQVVTMLAFTLFYYLLLMLPPIISGNPDGLASIDINKVTQDVLMPSYILSGVLTFFSAWAIHAIFKRKFFNRLSLNRTPSILVSISFLLGIALQMPISFIMGLLESAGLAPDMFEQYADSIDALMNNQSTFLLIIAIGIIAPIIEEVIFRGLIFHLLKNNMPVWAALIIQAALFGFAHLNLIQGSYAFALGIIMGLSLVWSKSMYLPIAIHVGMNLMGIALSQYGNALSDTTSMILLFVSFLLIPICIVYIYRKTKKNAIPVEDTDDLIEMTKV